MWQRLGQSQPVGPVIPHDSWRAGAEPACMYVRYVGSPNEQSTAGANPPTPHTTPTMRKRPKRHWPAKDGPPTRPRRSRTGLRRAGDQGVGATLGFALTPRSLSRREVRRGGLQRNEGPPQVRRKPHLFRTIPDDGYRLARSGKDEQTQVQPWCITALPRRGRTLWLNLANMVSRHASLGPARGAPRR